MDELTDAGLVHESLGGSAEAFALLVRRYQGYAYSVAAALLSDFELAQDVVQEAFLTAYGSLGKLREPERFGSWLHGIVRHTSHRARRELAQVRRLEVGLTPERGLLAEPPRPDLGVEERERRAMVGRALEKLSDANREVVGLYYTDGLSYADIARFLDVTETAVQGRLQRARTRLREELDVVKDAFEHEELPESFSDDTKQLLDEVAASRRSHGDAVRRLVEIGVPAVQELADSLGDSRRMVRLVAAQALCSIGDARARGPILRLLYADQPWWSWKLFVSGKVLRIPGVREALLEVIRKGVDAGTPRERVTPVMAIHAISHLEGDGEAIDLIGRLYNDASAHPRLRQSAFEGLWRLQPESRDDLAIDGLHDTDLQVRRTAAFFARRYDLAPPIDACLKAFEEGVSWWGRRCAADLVLEHGEEGRAVLRQVMDTGSPAERSTAAVALARFGQPEAFEVLKEELLGLRGDRNWTKEVSRTLAHEYGEDVVRWLDEEGGESPDFNRMLWTMARTRVEAGPLVEGLYADGPPAIRAAATRILARQRGVEFLPQLRQCLAAGRPRKVAQEAFWQVLRLGEAAHPTARKMLGSQAWTERKAGVSLLRRWGQLTPDEQAAAEADEHVAVRHAARWKARDRWHLK